MKRLVFSLTMLLCTTGMISAEFFKSAIESDSLEQFKYDLQSHGWRLRSDENLRTSLLQASELKVEELNQALQSGQPVSFKLVGKGLVFLGASAASGAFFHWICKDFEGHWNHSLQGDFAGADLIALSIVAPLTSLVCGATSGIAMYDGICYQSYVKKALKNHQEIQTIIRSYDENN
jgi:hypothetical protein